MTMTMKHTDEYYLWASDLEAEWRNSLPTYRETEWIEIFPEIQSIALAKIRELEKSCASRGDEIKQKLLDVRTITRAPLTREFLNAWIKHTDGVELAQIQVDIRRLKSYLPLRESQSTDITPEKIMRALEYPVTDLLNRYTAVRRAGKHYLALCPFHNERSPSLTVYPRTNSAFCFGCSIGGDSIALIRKLEHLTFPEAVNQLTQGV